MDVKQVMGGLKERINKELENYFSAYSDDIYKDIKEFTLRDGKRIRPTLVVYGYKAFGGEVEEEIIKASIAVELLQSFLLIHDDIIDSDEMRRGRPTLHKVYEEKYSDLEGSEKLGKDIAIIAGDMASAMGQEIIQSVNFSADVKLRAIKVFNQALMNTCKGQAMDILSTYKQEFDESEIEAVHKLKTATYTLEAPLMLGAVFAGAKEEEIEKLKEFAIPMGKAFQLQDDIIGLFGDEERTGKPIGSDLREGKKTFLISKALEAANEEDKEFLYSVLGNNELTQQDILRTRRIVEESGSLEYSKEKAEELLQQSLDKLEQIEITEEAKEFFKGIAEYMRRREY